MLAIGAGVATQLPRLEVAVPVGVINVVATIYFIVIYRSALMLLFYRLLGIGVR